MDRSIPALENVSAKAKKTAIRYSGEVALRYDAKRMNTPKWIGEEHRVREFLSDLPQGTSILDIPCGTGRFFPYYQERGFKVVAMDISPDMLAQARKRAAPNVLVEEGSIFNIETCLFHVVLCIRFLNLIEAEDVKLALANMQRVARFRVIFTLRVHHPNPSGKYHHPYPLSLVEESLLPKWTIGRNERAHDEDYRLIELVK